VRGVAGCASPVTCTNEDPQCATGSQCGWNAIDLCPGGVFTGDTCQGTNLVDATCNTAGTPEVLYIVPRGSAEGGNTGPYYGPINLSDGFVWYVASVAITNCDRSAMSNYVCDQGSAVSMWVNDTVCMWFAIEKSGGGCGQFTFSLPRIK